MGPAQTLLLSFAVAIGIGTVLLSLPIATDAGVRAPFLDALFTATSAVCVTGLVVQNTATFWSPFGQTVILLLIQAGGFGIMTMSTFFAVLLGKRITLRERLLLKEALGEPTLSGLVRLTKTILLAALAIEIIGAAMLFPRLLADYPWPRAAALSVFHSISAFNNAGFDLFGNSLEGFRTDLYVNLVVMALIVIGGLGFGVLADLYWFRSKARRHRLSFHTRLVILTTGVLLLAGTITILAFEYRNPETLGNLSLGQKITASLFHSVTPRTAGFNTLPVAQLRPQTLLLTMMLMFVGGSPGSTAGGVKTTTFGVIIAAFISTIRGRRDAEFNRRRIERAAVDRAWALVILGFSLVLLSSFVLLLTEQAGFLEVIFETMSAFGTVGLSMGLTPALSPIGKLVVSFTMYAGRVGPLTLFIALTRRQAYPPRIRYPEEKLIVG